MGVDGLYKGRELFGKVPAVEPQHIGRARDEGHGSGSGIGACHGQAAFEWEGQGDRYRQ